MEPKVPKIVVGGSPSATNVPVTGRYIQLLGLGTVLITKVESDLFQLLRSHEGFDTDLVRRCTPKVCCSTNASHSTC